MAYQQLQIAEFLLNDFYGPIVSAVSNQLLKNLSLSFPQLKKRVPSIPVSKVKETLMSLLQNGIATSTTDSNNDLKTQFGLPIENVLTIIHWAGFVYRANLLFGQEAREIAHEFTLHGQLTAKEVIAIVVERLEASEADVRKALKKMIETGFIQTSELYRQHLISKNNSDEKSVLVTLKKYNTQLTEDEDVMYSLFKRRFYEQERSELIVDLVGALHPHHYTKNIMRCIIRILEMKSSEDFQLKASPPIQEDEILNIVEKDLKISRGETLQCLKTLTFVPRNTQYKIEDDILVLKKDSFQQNSYFVDWPLAIKLWLRQTVLRYASDRHGRHASCILGMLLLHGASEMDFIQKQTLICPKEAKCVIYTLENDGFVERIENFTAGEAHRQEPKYRSTYLILARLLEQRWEQAIFNVLVQRKQLSDKHRVLLNKYKTLEKFTRSLEDPEEIKDVWGSLTKPERQTLSTFRQQMLYTGVQQHKLGRELIMLRQATKLFSDQLQ